MSNDIIDESPLATSDDSSMLWAEWGGKIDLTPEDADVSISPPTRSTRISGNSLTDSTLNSIHIGDSIMSLFVDRIKPLPSVSEVYEYREPSRTQIECWVVINEDNFELENHIYTIEYDLLGLVDDGDLETHVVFVGDDPDLQRIPEKAWKAFDRESGSFYARSF